MLGDRSIDADGVRTLANLPSREVLLGKLWWRQVPIASRRACVSRNSIGIGYASARRDEAASRAVIRVLVTLTTTRNDASATWPEPAN